MKSLLILSALCATAAAQSGGPWALTSSTLDGGGATSSSGPWTLTGTIGQPDASIALPANAIWSSEGGFWPGVLNLPGGPSLTITILSPSNQARLDWTSAAVGYKLQYSNNLVVWDDYPITITGPSSAFFGLHNGPRYFFRLEKL